jgi:hypothetical protein
MSSEGVQAKELGQQLPRQKWWYIISEHNPDMLSRLRGDKAFKGKKMTKKAIHGEIADLISNHHLTHF